MEGAVSGEIGADPLIDVGRVEMTPCGLEPCSKRTCAVVEARVVDVN